MDRFAQYAIVASDEAIADANLDGVDKLRVGVIWGRRHLRVALELVLPWRTSSAR